MENMRTILSITGKPGLFRLLSQGKNSIIVEDVTTKRRFPAHSRDKIVSLGDIAMYTEEEDKPLPEILDILYKLYDGKPVDTAAIKSFKEEFAKAVPNFDRIRVHESDIKKLFQWYNILVRAGFTQFVEEEEKPTPDEAQPEA